MIDAASNVAALQAEADAAAFLDATSGVSLAALVSDAETALDAQARVQERLREIRDEFDEDLARQLAANAGISYNVEEQTNRWHLLVLVVRTIGNEFSRWASTLQGVSDLARLTLQIVGQLATQLAQAGILAIGSRTFGDALGEVFGRRQFGGPVHAGRTYMIGEAGPELVTFGRSGYVTPSAPARAGGELNVNVYGDVSAQVRNEVFALIPAIRRGVFASG